MLVIIVRTAIVFIFLLVIMRLMGKRQIGELQPFEFVITLAAAELACTPMQDISIPVLYGIIPVAVIFVLHSFGTMLSTRFIRVRKLLNGKPVIVINQDGIDADGLKKLNMNVNDLLESIRGQEYFSIEQVSFAIVETNGNVSVLPNSQAQPPQSIPLSLVVEGKLIDENFEISDTNKQKVLGYLKSKNLALKDVVLLTVESKKVFVQPLKGKYFTEVLQDGGAL